MNKIFFIHQVKKLSTVLRTNYEKLSIFDSAVLRNYLYIKDSRYAFMKNWACFCDICFYISWKYFDIHSIILKKFCKLLSSEYNIELSKLIDMGKSRHEYYDSIDSKATFDELVQIIIKEIGEKQFVPFDSNTPFTIIGFSEQMRLQMELTALLAGVTPMLSDE